jgi:hypothetical protein
LSSLTVTSDVDVPSAGIDVGTAVILDRSGEARPLTRTSTATLWGELIADGLRTSTVARYSPGRKPGSSTETVRVAGAVVGFTPALSHPVGPVGGYLTLDVREPRTPDPRFVTATV